MKKIILFSCIAVLFYACIPMESTEGRLYGVKFGNTSYSMDYGSTRTLTVTVAPSRSYNKVTFTWESSNPSIIEVDQKGKLSALRHGEVMITVTATLGEESTKDSCFVEVVPVKIILPDAVFMNYCLSEFDRNRDGFLTSNETENVLDIYVSNENIASLEGLHYFPNLKSLDCVSNQLTTLDISKNKALSYLNCSHNQLTALDISNNTALLYLYCFDNMLSALHVGKNTALQHLYCFSNQLTALDISKNTALEVLWCYTNGLTALDVSKNTALFHLDCKDNPNLTKLWLRTGQTIETLHKSYYTEIKFKD